MRLVDDEEELEPEHDTDAIETSYGGFYLPEDKRPRHVGGVGEWKPTPVDLSHLPPEGEGHHGMKVKAEPHIDPTYEEESTNGNGMGHDEL